MSHPTAKEMYWLAKRNNAAIKKVFKKIEETASNGEFVLHVGLTRDCECIEFDENSIIYAKEAIDILEGLGYDCSILRHKRSPSELIIFWSNIRP